MKCWSSARHVFSWALAFAEWDYAEARWEHCRRMDVFYLMTLGDRR